MNLIQLLILTHFLFILDHFIHPPPANKELGFKLSRLKRSIFSIFRKHKRILQNLSSTQRHILSTMRYKELIYLPSDKGKEFCVISRNTYNQLALNHFKDNNIYTEVTDIQSTQLENLINNAWTNICKRRNIRNKYKNNFNTQNNKLPNFYHPIKTHRTNTRLKIRPILSNLERPLYEIPWLLAQTLKPLLPTFPGHVKNSDEVIHWLTQLNAEKLKQNNYAFSLGVISLYTTVLAQPTIDIISEHIISKNLYCHKLIASGIHQLLSIIVDNTYFTYNGNTKKQISGLSMGSSISSIQAFIYMDQLERRAYSLKDI